MLKLKVAFKQNKKIDDACDIDASAHFVLVSRSMKLIWGTCLLQIPNYIVVANKFDMNTVLLYCSPNTKVNYCTF